MVSASHRSARATVFLTLAVLTPFAFTTLYVTINQGSAAPNRVIHETLLVLIACSCLPFVYLLPFSFFIRALLGVFLACVLYVLAWCYGFWAACALFHNCI